MSFFNDYFNKSEDQLKEGKKKFVLNKVTRGFGSAADQIEEKIEDKVEKLESLRISVANGNVNDITKIAETLIDIEDMKSCLAVVKDEQERFLK